MLLIIMNLKEQVISLTVDPTTASEQVQDIAQSLEGVHPGEHRNSSGLYYEGEEIPCMSFLDLMLGTPLGHW